MAHDPSDTAHLLERLRGGDRQALTDLFQRHRELMLDKQMLQDIAKKASRPLSRNTLAAQVIL